jgi:hypothetical protein
LQPGVLLKPVCNRQQNALTKGANFFQNCGKFVSAADENFPQHLAKKKGGFILKPPFAFFAECCIIPYK